MVSHTWQAGAMAAAVMALASCGDSVAPDAKPAATVPAPAPTLTSIPVAAAKPPPPANTLTRMIEPATGDLDAIAARGYLRLLVVPSRTHYSVVDGMQRGWTVDAGAAFEAFLNSKLTTGQAPIQVVFVPTGEDALVKQLVAGRGDIAANLAFTFERDDQIAFGEPIRKGVREFVVTGPGVPPLVSLEDVAGRAIHVRMSSDHHASLVRLNDQLKRVDKPVCKIVMADESVTNEDLLEQVNAGTIPATLVDDHVYRQVRSRLSRIAANEDVAVSQDGIVAWATRKDSPTLLALLNEFVRSRDIARTGTR